MKVYSWLFPALITQHSSSYKIHATASALLKQQHIQTNFADTLDHDGITDFDIIPNYSPLKNYKDRVESYVREHKDHLVIQKLKKNKPITQEAFADFIHAGNLRADQMTFMNTIITYLTKNGVIEKKMLFEAPFTDLHHEGLFGLFDDADAGKVIRLIDEVNGNAVAMTG